MFQLNSTYILFRKVDGIPPWPGLHNEEVERLATVYHSNPTETKQKIIFF